MEARAWLQGLQLDPKSPLFSGLTNLINKQRNNGKFLDDLKYLFIYDTGSNVIPATISNPDFAMKIRVAKRPKTISTSTGRGTFNLEAFVKELGWCPFDENGVTNIIAAKWLVDNGYRVTYDSMVEDAYIAYEKDGSEMMKFKCTDEGLYACMSLRGVLSIGER
jgi:hypothetical protein